MIIAKICLFLIIGCVFVYFSVGLPEVFAQQVYSFVIKWGSLGNYDGLLNVPASLAVDSSGNLYVTDTNNNRIEKFSSDGKFLSKWGTAGSGPGEFDLPTGITLDTAGNIYVTDQSNNRIQEFNSAGSYIREFNLLGLFPRGIALDSAGNLYFTDPAKDLLVKFANDGHEIASWGGYGTVTGKFDTPSSIALDRNANVYVVDTGNARIQKFTSDGQFLASWGSFGAGNGQFLKPTGIAIDSAGNVYVSDADYDHPSIQKFTIGNTTISTQQKSTVPEFGTTNIVVLTISILSLLIFTSTKFRFKN
jgi:sugar lactone lactonase YvrE